MLADLFADQSSALPERERLGAGALLLRGFALAESAALLAAIAHIVQLSPFRQMETRAGHRMSVAMSNCGRLGWVSDRQGYRYAGIDPESGRPWPSMPESFLGLAARAAAAAGFAGFVPDACLINRYEPGARMGLHQDKDERDLQAPIVSLSLGLPAVFLWGGRCRADPVQRVGLQHGDVVVWGGEDRLRYHGVAPMKPSWHVQTGTCRINLTFRKAT